MDTIKSQPVIEISLHKFVDCMTCDIPTLSLIFHEKTKHF
jgi:hypothetical protein